MIGLASLAESGAWDEEYRRAGIPSSRRNAPSAAVIWALASWPLLADHPLPRRALDVGCGTARNAVYLANRGVHVTALDLSGAAVAAARRRAAGVDVEVLLHDLNAGLPARDFDIDLVLDVFVYKHHVDPDTRRAYRHELRRVLSSDGRVLICLAESDDGYYGECPPLDGGGGGPQAVFDPMLGLGSVLFSLEELVAEVSDVLALEMAWRKQGTGVMHGRQYMRRTLATLWRPRPTGRS